MHSVVSNVWTLHRPVGVVHDQPSVTAWTALRIKLVVLQSLLQAHQAPGAINLNLTRLDVKFLHADLVLRLPLHAEAESDEQDFTANVHESFFVSVSGAPYRKRSYLRPSASSSRPRAVLISRTSRSCATRKILRRNSWSASGLAAICHPRCCR
jgi:hypothetical protein